jgi:hypothetical protein
MVPKLALIDRHYQLEQKAKAVARTTARRPRLADRRRLICLCLPGT